MMERISGFFLAILTFIAGLFGALFAVGDFFRYRRLRGMSAKTPRH